jgi:formylmethanofuran dehydrogenase subunit E
MIEEAPWQECAAFHGHCCPGLGIGSRVGYRAAQAARQRLDVAFAAGARIFAGVVCEDCGEAAPEDKARLHEDKKVCLDCVPDYSRRW